MLTWKSAKGKAKCRAPVRLPAECFGGDAGRPVVSADHPGLDAVGPPNLQGIPGFLRTPGVEHIGRPVAKAGSVRNYPGQARPVRRAKADLSAHAKGNGPCPGVDGNGAVGGQARKNRKPAAHQADAEGQREILGTNSPALGTEQISPSSQ